MSDSLEKTLMLGKTEGYSIFGQVIAMFIRSFHGSKCCFAQGVTVVTMVTVILGVDPLLKRPTRPTRIVTLPWKSCSE